jgi:hypothetical protein
MTLLCKSHVGTGSSADCWFGSSRIIQPISSVEGSSNKLKIGTPPSAPT